MLPSGLRTLPASRSCTYSRNLSFVASLAIFGRFAACCAFHCATKARYSGFPPRVAAFRRNSRETVPGSRPILRAISRTPICLARSSAISSRSSKDR